MNVFFYLKMSILTGTLVAIIGVGGLSGQAQAFNPQPEPPASLALGIVESQIAVLHVLAPPTVLNQDPSAVRLALYHADGKELQTLKGKVEPGQVLSMRFPGRALGLGSGERATIYGVVQCLGRVAAKVGCAQTIVASLEVFDVETGKTQVVVPVVPGILPISDFEPVQ